MAVTDESLHQATDSLILRKPQQHYRADIHTSHWQLRSLISAPEKHLIYYPSGSDVYVLNTKTKERQHITTLPFTPLCLTVEKGWLCCGGHHGKYTSVCLDDTKTETESSLGLDLDPDARLPLDLDPTRRSLPRDIASTSRRTRGPVRPLPASLKFFGVEKKEDDNAINNCISLWFPKNTASERAYKLPVAVLANNDSSVYMLDLKESEVMERLSYPDCVNRAVISPDGELLVAVLDDPFLYVHQRRRRAELTPGLFSEKEHYEWHPMCRIQLTGQSQADKTSMKGSFALTFSNSGQYLAVATQHGVISVFDVETLADENARPISVFTSSRPGIASGAVRTMQFSPGPFEILAWTETSGRVGISDIRSLFVARQLLQVDSRLDVVESMHVMERAGEATLDPRLRTFRSDSPSSTPDYLGLDFERRQLRQMAREMLDRHQAPLTSEELEVLQAHRIARRARDAFASVPSAAIWDLTSYGQRNTNAPNDTPAGAAGAANTGTDRRHSSGLPGILREYTTIDRTTASFRNFINERNQDRERRNQQLETRRRSSVILAAAERAIETETSASTSRSGNEPTTNLERLTLTTTTGTDTPSNPWSEIDALYRSRYPNPSTSTRQRIEYEDEDRQTLARLRQPWRADTGIGARDESTMIIRGMLRNRHDDEEDRPPDIMGLSWSPDGRLLYVGADDGIYEYHVNIAGRKKFPSIVLR